MWCMCNLGIKFGSFLSDFIKKPFPPISDNSAPPVRPVVESMSKNYCSYIFGFWINILNDGVASGT